MKDEYIRIGTNIYKRATLPNGEETLIPWSSQAIFQDYGKDKGKELLADMQKYDGWVNEPSHVNYQPFVGQWVNLYQPLPHEPRGGIDFPNIREFLQHIFGEWYELGIDYFQLLYMKPKQKLPILLLVSKQRNTGKTTFLNFLKEIFGKNATFNSNEDFRSQFNADWANKLLIMVDETFLNTREQAERLKNLSTATIYKAEAKGKDRVEVDFHGHFVLCSNNTTRPIIIEDGETRYWAISVPRLESEDTLLMEKLIYEMPAFLDFLCHRKLSTERKSRMWFAPELYHTDALDRIIANARESIEADMADVLRRIFDAKDIEEICVCTKDLSFLLHAAGCRKDIKDRDIRRVLQCHWDLKAEANSYTYTTYEPAGIDNYRETQKIGRFYTVPRNLIEKITF